MVTLFKCYFAVCTTAQTFQTTPYSRMLGYIHVSYVFNSNGKMFIGTEQFSWISIWTLYIFIYSNWAPHVSWTRYIFCVAILLQRTVGLQKLFEIFVQWLKLQFIKFKKKNRFIMAADMATLWKNVKVLK